MPNPNKTVYNARQPKAWAEIESASFPKYSLAFAQAEVWREQYKDKRYRVKDGSYAIGPRGGNWRTYTVKVFDTRPEEG